MQYFWQERRARRDDERVKCVDKLCECASTSLGLKDCYLYISPDAAEFRADAITFEQAKAKVASLKAAGKLTATPKQSKWTGVIYCEAAAKRRGLDLNVARADAEHWWRTGQMPLRATPLADKKGNILLGGVIEKPRKWYEFWKGDPLSRVKFVFVFTSTSAPVTNKVDYTAGTVDQHKTWALGMAELARVAFPDMKWPPHALFGGAYDSKPDPHFSESYKEELCRLAWSAYQGMLVRENVDRMRQKKSALPMGKRTDYDIDVARTDKGSNTDVAVIRQK